LLLDEVLKVSKSEAAVRLLSALCGLAAIPLIYLLGRALMRPAVGLIAAAFLALSPFALYYSQEARPYALLLLLSLASVYSLLVAVERHAWWKWIIYALVTIAGLYTHYFVVFLILAQGIVLLSFGEYRKTALSRWALCQVAAIFSFLPWFPYMLFQFHWQSAQGGQTWVPQVGALLIPHTFYQFSLGYSAANIKSLEDLAANTGLLVPGTLGFGIPFFVSLLSIKRYPLAGRWAWLILAITIGTTFLLNLKLHFYQPTYLAGIMPLYLILLASGVWLLRRSLLLPISLILMASLYGISLSNYYSNPQFSKEDWRGAAAYLQAQVKPTDIIVFHKSWLRDPFNYYYTGETPQAVLPDKILSPDAPVMQEIKRELSAHPTVWLIVAHNFDTGSYYRDLLGRWFLEKNCRVFQVGRAIVVCEFAPREKPSVSQKAAEWKKTQ
jgi:uncharacterized membrane protein